LLTCVFYFVLKENPDDFVVDEALWVIGVGRREVEVVVETAGLEG
jgi:hypothetical protein